MSHTPPIIMVDTNVWLDLFIPDRPKRDDALAFFRASQGDAAELVFTLEIARAVFRYVSAEAKRWFRESQGELADHQAQAIMQHAWDFIDDMQRWATPVGGSPVDLWFASNLRDEHAGIEDDLIIAACMRIDTDYLVTNDEKLIKQSPVAAITPAMAAKLLT